MKKTILIIFNICTSIVMMAQNDCVSKINNIKIDSTFLYGEATLKTRESASALAKDILNNNIKEWIEAETKSPCLIIPTSLTDNLDSIVTKRANMIRVFKYVRKADLLQSLHRAGINMGNVKHMPDTIPIFDQTLHNGQSILNQLITIKSFYQLRGVIEPLHAKGFIKNYGKYNTMTEPNNCYLIIYDSDGEIRAVLDKGESSRKNLSTGKEDSEHNYSGCGAIWFQLNK